jgi:hypothetical protein
LDKEVSAVVKIGKLNSNFEFSEVYRELALESAQFEMGIGIISDQIGYNLLTGIVYYKKNNKIIREALFFEDYVVVPSGAGLHPPARSDMKVKQYPPC